MGYTHHWTKQKDPTPEQWNRVTENFRLVYSNAQAKALITMTPLPPIQFESDGTRPPQIGAVIRFNGVGKDGHETFCLDPAFEDIEFCKTARKPYDLWVVVAMTLLNHFASGCWDINSDGNASDWADGVNLVQQFFPDAPNPMIAQPEE